MTTMQTTQFQDPRTLAQIKKDTELAQQARDQAVQASLAKLLASENIHVEFRKVHTASFNVKSRVLIIPVFAPDLKAETVSMLVEHEVGHALYTPTEGWHGTLDKRGPGFKSYLNVMEDVRIERKIKAKFPGTRRDFHIGYQDLVSQNFFGPLVNARHFQLIDKINVYAKCGPTVANFAFTSEEQALLEQAQRAETWDEVVDVALAVCKFDVAAERASEEAFSAEFGKKNQIRGNQDTDDYDDEDYNYGDDEEESDLDDLEDPWTPKKKDEEDDLSDMDEDEEATAPKNGEFVKPADSSEEEEEEPKGEKTNVAGAETPSADGLDEEEEEEENEENASEDGAGYQGPITPEDREIAAREIPLDDDETKAVKSARQSATDEQFRNNERMLFDANARDVLYYDIGNPPPMESIVVDYKRVLTALVKTFVQEARYANCNITEAMALAQLDEQVIKAIKSFRKRHEGYITNLVRVFELKKNAEQFARASEAKTGQLNLTKMHQYKFNDDLFRRIVNIPKGKNHGVLMFVDFSGSMNKTIKSVMEQAAVLAAFCRRIQVPFRVMTFTDGSRIGKQLFKTADYSVTHTNEFQFKYDTDVFMPEFFNNKMTMQEFNRALFFTAAGGFRYLNGTFSMGGTPLDQCILQLPNIVTSFKKETNAEKITAIYLTDGDSTDHFFTARFKKGTSSPSDYYSDYEYAHPTKHIMVFRNKWTRKNVQIEPTREERYSGGADQSFTSFSYTQAILRTVREATGCTLLGYFIVSGYDASRMIMDYQQYTVKTAEQLKSEFRTQYFMSFENYGYNQYFILWDKALSGTAKEGEDPTDPTTAKVMTETNAKTNKGLATAFTKMKVDAARNRVFVTKFMTLVAA